MVKKTYSTEELAKLLHVKTGTIRRGLCVDGHYMLMRPVKLPNGRLIWPSEPVEKLLNGASASDLQSTSTLAQRQGIALGLGAQDDFVLDGGLPRSQYDHVVKIKNKMNYD